MQEAGASSQPAPGPSHGPSPVKRSYSDSIGSRQMGPSPGKRPFVLSHEENQQKDMEKLLKKEAFLENQLFHLLEGLRQRFDEERQIIAEEQRKLENRLIEMNENLKVEEKTIRENNAVKLAEVRQQINQLKGSLSPKTNEPPPLHTYRGPLVDVGPEVRHNSAAGREDVGSAAHLEHDLSTSQQSEVALSSPEVLQPNEESDGEISSSSDILILQAAGLLAEIGEVPHTGEVETGPCDAKDEEQEVVADSSEAEKKGDSSEGRDQEKDSAILKLKTIGHVFEEELQCSICNELLVAAVTINCAHSFCKHCLGEWKKQRAECPMCRVPITAEHRSVTLDSLIDTLVGQLSVELQQRHKEVQEERAAIDAAAAVASSAAASNATGGAAAAVGAGARHGNAPARGPRGHHHNNYNWQPHPGVPPPPPHHPYAHPHAHVPFPPHAHAHPPHAHPPHAHPPHAHPPLAHPPPHAHVPPPHVLPPPAHTHAPHNHIQPARPPPGPGPADSPDHHLRVRRRHGRVILSSGSSSGSSAEEPSDSQSSYTSSGGFSNASDNSWFDAQYMSAEYEDDDGEYEAPVVPGIPGRYYGGYGVCFYCNQRGHWSNGCPVRFGGF